MKKADVSKQCNEKRVALDVVVIEVTWNWIGDWNWKQLINTKEIKKGSPKNFGNGISQGAEKGINPI